MIEQIILIVLVIFGMILSWKFGFDTGWIKGFYKGFNKKK